MVPRASFIRDFLQSKFKLLQPDEYQQMHSKAAEWFKQQRYLMEGDLSRPTGRRSAADFVIAQHGMS